MGSNNKKKNVNGANINNQSAAAHNSNNSQRHDESKGIEDIVTKGLVYLSGEPSKHMSLNKSNKQHLSQLSKFTKTVNSNNPGAVRLINKAENAPSEVNEASKYDFRDFMNGLSKQYNQLNKTLGSEEVKSSDSLIVNEAMLDNELGLLAQELASQYKRFYNAIETSNSIYYTAQDRFDAKNLQAQIDVLVGVGTEASRVKALRLAFIATLSSAMCVKFPNVSTRVISWTTLQVMQNESKFLRKFVRNSAVSDEDYKDERGLPDVNCELPLPFLPITDHFKEILAARGVSIDTLNMLDNYRLKRGSKDERYSLRSTSFEVFDINSGSISAKRYCGPNDLTEIQLKMIDFIDKFKMKSTSVIASTMEDPKNMFDPDLAVKIFILNALNSVYKIILEDSFGVIERVKESQIRNLESKTSAYLFDTAMELLTVNHLYFKTPVDKAKEMLTSGIFRFNPDVYRFLKENWAPHVKKFSVNNSIFIGDSKVTGDNCIMTILPYIVLPCNPYDRFYDEDISSNTADSSARSVVQTKGVISCLFRTAKSNIYENTYS